MTDAPEEPIIPVELLREMADLVYDLATGQWKFPVVPIEECDKVRDKIYQAAKEAVLAMGIQDTPVERHNYLGESGAWISISLSYLQGTYPVEHLNENLRDTGRVVYAKESQSYPPVPESKIGREL